MRAEFFTPRDGMFATVTFAFTTDLASGRGLGRFLAAAMAVFWTCRVPVQLFYYDPVLRHDNRRADVVHYQFQRIGGLQGQMLAHVPGRQANESVEEA